MASGKDLKRRITSVKSTQQITKALKMVSAARLGRAQDAIVRARPFAQAIQGVVQGLMRNPELRDAHPLLAKREVKRVNVVLITSDRGLCGSFNSSLQKKAEAMYKAEAGNYENFAFTCIGKKGYEYLTHRKIPVAEYFPDFQKGMSYAKAHAIAEGLMKKFIAGEWDEIRVVYSEFRSAISQVVQATNLLPAKVDTSSTQTGAADFLFEPSREAILADLLPRYVNASFYRALLESVASEHGARMSAMENATKNAGEMIKKLTLEFNKVRQAGITKELLEIVSGAEALK